MLIMIAVSDAHLDLKAVKSVYVINYFITLIIIIPKKLTLTVPIGFDGLNCKKIFKPPGDVTVS